MKRIAELILEAGFLKHLPRSGYQFLGAGRESVAEHVYATTFIAFVLSQLAEGVNAHKLITMCLVHDLPEARLGDLNYVQKRYLSSDEPKAISDALQEIPFGPKIAALIEEFNEATTLEARLAHDADQLALILDLKHLHDVGYQTPDTWLPHVQERLQTKLARQLAQAVLEDRWDGWWLKLFC
jgi:5'-deoxynucleotidase YfbR-like HD superfamily hydrolase